MKQGAEKSLPDWAKSEIVFMVAGSKMWDPCGEKRS
jgi:hypothetical protein